MQFKLISDSHDTLVGLRLAGIDGVIVHTAEDVIDNLNKFSADENIGIILITERLSKLCDDYITNIKLTRKTPLIVEIPNRTTDENSDSTVLRYIKEAIGMKI